MADVDLGDQRGEAPACPEGLRADIEGRLGAYELNYGHEKPAGTSDPPTHYRLRGLMLCDEELVEALGGWSEQSRAATVKAFEQAGFLRAHEALAALEPLAKRASTEGKNLYLCIHIP